MYQGGPPGGGQPGYGYQQPTQGYQQPPQGYQSQPSMQGYQHPPQGYQQPPPQAYQTQPSMQGYQHPPQGYQQPPPAQPPPAHTGYGAPAPGQPSPQLVAWFRSIDTDNSGLLDSVELQKALGMGNLNYSISDVDAMIRAFDQKNTRSLNMQEFGKLHEFLMSVTASFSFYDSDHNKMLESQEVTAALKQAGFTMDPPVLQVMMKKYDLSNKGVLKLDEYIRMCLFLQSCVRTFGAFDSTKTGKITLDFNQFVYAASHIC